VVAPGDTIVWINKDLVPHTATSETGGFDSSVILASQSWRYTVQKKKGDFSYVCTLHPAMKGRLRVR
jgi:plastocyanin